MNNKQSSFFDNVLTDQGEGRTSTLSSGFPDKMVLLDCETTGGKATYHRIIEIGLIVVEQGEIVETWESFIQPDQQIPEAITRLTGIHQAMVADAPRFEDIADILLSKLELRTFVAHNARFDYGFIKNEFSRMGINYKAEPLCSVKFSRSLYPQFKRHGLDQIIKRFGFKIENRHRAFDDASMIYKFFLESSRLFSDDDIAAVCADISKRPTLPSKLNAKVIDKLPKSPGVYYFYDERGELLYVGKSVNIRNRVLNHFSQDHKNPKDLRMSARIADISFDTTPSDFGAQLLESEQIKKLSPTFNRRLRKSRTLFGLSIEFDCEGYAVSKIRDQHLSGPDDEQYGLFRTRHQVIKKLEQLADQYQLCPRLLGLENGSKACFRYQLKKCKGACCGQESSESYNQRLFAALENYQRKVWPWPDAIVVEEKQSETPSTLHLIKDWVYLRKLSTPEDIYDYGYRFTKPSEKPWEKLADSQRGGQVDDPEHFDLDAYYILVRFLLNPELIAVNKLKIHPLAMQGDL